MPHEHAAEILDQVARTNSLIEKLWEPLTDSDKVAIGDFCHRIDFSEIDAALTRGVMSSDGKAVAFLIILAEALKEVAQIDGL